MILQPIDSFYDRRDADAARPTCSRVYLFSLLWAAIFFAPAIAQAGDGAATALGSWVMQLAAVIVLFVGILKIYDYFRAKPPLHQQFAPLTHNHDTFATKAEASACRDGQARELLAMRQEMGGMTAKVERQIDYLRNSLTTQSDQLLSAIKELDDKQETRIRRVHDRLDPLPAAIAANTRSIETHLADHRAGKD